jgi:cytochrome c biogenesis protein CcmG, thiol:disulfide interchange protein DsbE
MMKADVSPQSSQGKARPKTALILPLVVVIALVVLFIKVLGIRAQPGGGPSELPSPLIGKLVPEFSLPGIPNVLGDYGPATGLSSAGLKTGKASLLNFWASWCVPCVAEHDQLIALNQKGIPVYGINYKNKQEDARRFLSNHGNPFRSIGADTEGLVGIDFGVTGVPETFVIDGSGRVAYRYQGPITPEILNDKIIPAIQKAESAGSRS